jgi:mono/diheme cytochrome c family protein
VLKRTLLIGVIALSSTFLSAQQQGQSGGQTPAPAGGAQASAAAGGGGGSVDLKNSKPQQLADATPKGQLKNPYQDTDQAAVTEGGQFFLNYGCNGCHGGTGGGGMCPPLTNDTWVYGGDDDTLFRLVTYGSDTLQTKGYTRTGHENVVGPMPAMGGVVQKSDELWKILAWVRSHYNGAPECKLGCKS